MLHKLQNRSCFKREGANYCQTSMGVRCSPAFSWLFSSANFSRIWRIEKFKVKLNGICTFCKRNALCGGIIVIPPGNLSTSKEDASPNKDLVSSRDESFTTKDTKEPLIRLWSVDDIFESFSSGSTPNTTFVLFDPAKGSRDRITTCLNI